jgi:2-dehydro-3-deoxyphosphogluconate aldolase/(4S)-4-hydroxy-2-oxoglutarate aldolase
MTNPSSTLEQIMQYRIVAILRGFDPDHIQPIAEALYEGGIRLIEITLNSPDALAAIERLNSALGDRLLIGAGTVLEPAEAVSAIAAGARFILSPSLDTAIIRRTLDMGAVSIPGVFTATELYTAWRNGAAMVKVFPASVGPAYIRDLRGPFPQIPLMPTGGVSIDNIREFHRAGAAAFGIGSALAKPVGMLTEDYLKDLTRKAAVFVQTLKPDDSC